MAPPLTLDGSAKTGDAGRDLLRLTISSLNTDARIFVNGANAGRLGLIVWDEPHAQLGNLTAYQGTFTVLSGLTFSGGVTIGAFNDNHLFLLSSNSAYGWRIDTIDNGSGDVPLRIYKRTASTDTLALSIKNADGAVIVGSSDPGGNELFRVGGNVKLPTGGKVFFGGSSSTGFGLRGNAGSPVALECVAGDESAYAAFRASTIYATVGFSGDGSALTNLPGKLIGQLQGLSTTSLSEVSLGTVSVPAGKLGTNAQAVRITVGGRVTGGSATGTVRVKFGATYLDANNAMSTGSKFVNTYIVTRTGAATQLANGSEFGYLGFTYVGGGAPTAAPAETLSGAVTIDVRGLTGSGLTTLFVDTVQVEYLAA